MENIPRRSLEHSQRSQASQPAQSMPPQPVQSTQAPQPIRSATGRGPKKPFRLKPLIIAILAVVVVAGLIVVGSILFRQFSGGTAIDSNKYQAVFLSNGQVYFGKLQNSAGEYLRLTNVFYLQTKTDPATQNPQTTSTNGNNVELVKLGSEIHGPDDQMVINHSQVLFYENLKPDGRVSQSITNYAKK